MKAARFHVEDKNGRYLQPVLRKRDRNLFLCIPIEDVEEYVAVAFEFVLNHSASPHLRYGNFCKHIVFIDALRVYLLHADSFLHHLAIHYVIGCCLEILN